MNRLFLLLLVGFSGCLGITNASTKEAVVTGSQVEVDNFKKTAWLNGPSMRANILRESTKKDKADWQVHTYLLREMKDDKSGKGFIQLYVSHQDTDWLFFNQAIDSDGNKLELIPIDQQTSVNTSYGVGVIEDFAISMDEAYLRKHVKDGLRIRVYGKRGERTAEVPGFYVEGFLERHDAFAKK